MERLLTVNETADILRLSRSLVWSYLQSGTIASCKFGRRRLVPAWAVQQFVEAHMAPASGANDTPALAGSSRSGK